MEKKESLYSSFWQDNLEKISRIQKNLDQNLMILEKDYYLFETVYRELEEDLDLLSSLYAGINTIEGMEYLQKLRALVHNYGKRYTREGIDFPALNYLSEKITRLRDLSFEDFPLLEHYESEKPGDRHKKITSYFARPFKWITFYRNKSWFITPFTDLSLIDAGTVSFSMKKGSRKISADSKDKTYTAIDIFGEFTSPPVKPDYFIEINKKTTFAADSLGKRIFSKRDIISDRITSFTITSGSDYAAGRVRLFGRQHIYIREQ